MFRILVNPENPESELYEIEEAAIMLQCTDVDDGEENIFEEALNLAHTFRVAGLTPLYFINPEEHILYVTSEEKITRQYY